MHPKSCIRWGTWLLFRHIEKETMTKQSVSDDLLWAHEVMEVYKNQGSLPGSRSWSSTSAQKMFEWCQDEKFYLKFVGDLVPKATAIITKAGLGDVSDAVLEIDAKTIGDLKIALSRAVEASQEKGKPVSEVEQMKDLVATSVSEPDLVDILGGEAPSIEDLF